MFAIFLMLMYASSFLFLSFSANIFFFYLNSIFFMTTRYLIVHLHSSRGSSSFGVTVIACVYYVWQGGVGQVAGQGKSNAEIKDEYRQETLDSAFYYWFID